MIAYIERRRNGRQIMRLGGFEYELWYQDLPADQPADEFPPLPQSLIDKPLDTCKHGLPKTVCTLCPPQPLTFGSGWIE